MVRGAHGVTGKGEGAQARSFFEENGDSCCEPAAAAAAAAVNSLSTAAAAAHTSQASPRNRCIALPLNVPHFKTAAQCIAACVQRHCQPHRINLPTVKTSKQLEQTQNTL